MNNDQQSEEYVALRDALVMALIETQGRHDSCQDRAVAIMKKINAEIKKIAEGEKKEPPLNYG